MNCGGVSVEQRWKKKPIWLQISVYYTLFFTTIYYYYRNIYNNFCKHFLFSCDQRKGISRGENRIRNTIVQEKNCTLIENMNVHRIGQILVEIFDLIRDFYSILNIYITKLEKNIYRFVPNRKKKKAMFEC